MQEWPYHQLGQRIIACLEEFGIACDATVNPDGISQTCRKCGSRSADYIQLAARLFVCGSCGHKEHLDINASGNVLARGASGGVLPALPGSDSEQLGKRKKPAERAARKPPRKRPESGGAQPTPGEA